jgi:hypothetical protein
MNWRWQSCLIFLVLFQALRVLPAVGEEAGRSADPVPSTGVTDKSGRTICKFVTRAMKNGQVMDVPYDADFWLPPGYKTQTAERYPVIYVLQNTDLPRSEMAQMFQRNQFPPFIVVHILGITRPLNGGEGGVWSDSLGPSGKIFRQEFTAWVERHFRCRPGPKGRVLIGCSKAGGGVMHLGLNYPDLFSAVVSADGAMGLYDLGNKDDGFYKKNKLRFLDAIERNGDAAKDLPTLMLLGSMFGSAGENDEYVNRLRAAGMRDLEFCDLRHFGHDCEGMTNASLPEEMATFYNGIGDFAPWKPSLSHRGAIYAGPLDVTVTLAEANWNIRYTVDGADPHRGGETTRGSIHVGTTCWLRVIGISNDGNKQTREALARYIIQKPLAAKPAGTEPGLSVRVYRGVPGKQLKNYLDEIQTGKKKELASTVVSGLGETAQILKQITDATATVVYTGTLTVPETRA